MAHTPTPDRTGMLHDRGDWSPRDDRWPTAVWLGIFWIGTIAGFGADFTHYLTRKPGPSLVLHFHAVVFTLWLVIFSVQVLAVLGDNLAWHRRFGRLAAGWTVLMAILGPWAAMAAKARLIHSPGLGEASAFLAINLNNMAWFLILVVWGLRLRNNPAAHRRMMMLSMVALADPGFSRLSDVFIQEPKSVVLWFFYMFYGNLGLMLLMAGWDWWKGRLMRQFVVACLLMTTGLVVATLLVFWPPWIALTTSWVQAWAGAFG